MCAKRFLKTKIHVIFHSNERKITWYIFALLRSAFTNRTYTDKIIETQKSKKDNRICTITYML